MALRWIGYLLLASLLGCAPALLAQEKGEGTDAAASTPVDAELQVKLASPRAAMRTFLRAPAKEAAVCLDLSDVGGSLAAKAKGEEYAFKLKAVIDRMWLVDYDAIPDDPSNTTPYVLADSTKHLTGEDLADARKIVIAPDAQGLWRFTPGTVRSIDELWKRWSDREVLQGVLSHDADPFPVWLEKQFPQRFRNTTFLLPDYQWMSLLVLVVLGFVADLVVRTLLTHLTRAWFRFVRKETDVAIDRKLWKPLGLLTQALMWYAGTKLIGLPAWALSALLVGLKFFAVVTAVWTAFMATNLLGAYLRRQAAKTETKFDDLLVPLVTKSLKVFAVLAGVLICGEAFNLPMKTLLGGTAIGGMALALASQDAVSNLFGSVTVLVDRPFEVGDWVLADNVEGTVETVGFRSTRIRTFYNSLITLPNSKLTTAVVDNMGKRRFRRIKTMLGVQYDTTPEQIDAFCEGIRELIRRHPYTRKDYYHVYFNEFAESSLNILLYCFLECPDWSIELREKHRLFADILRLASQLGVGFAFPTRTLHLHNEPPADPPPELASAEQTGARYAAQIAGPYLPPDQSRGPVEFRGPTDLDDESPE
jgi:MscS family membrane protein